MCPQIPYVTKCLLPFKCPQKITGLCSRLCEPEPAEPSQATRHSEEIPKSFKPSSSRRSSSGKDFILTLCCQCIQSIFLLAQNLSLFQDQNLKKTNVYFIKIDLQDVEHLFHKKIVFVYPLKIWGSNLLRRHCQLSMAAGNTPAIMSFSDSTLTLSSNLMEDKLRIENTGGIVEMK